MITGYAVVSPEGKVLWNTFSEDQVDIDLKWSVMGYRIKKVEYDDEKTNKKVETEH